LRRKGIASHDVRALRRATVRTRAVRLFLAVGGLALLAAAAAAAARGLDTREKALLPQGSVGVVVIDVSLSIADRDYDTVRAALHRLVEEDARVGLIMFSDVPYELLPPGTPAVEMQPMLRLLAPSGAGPPVNPWVQTFRAGTQISSALELAQRMLERDEVVDGSVLLISDLETAPDDVAPLARRVAALRSDGIDVRVIGLAPSSDARAIFSGLLEDEAFVLPLAADAPLALGSEARHGLPTLLLLLGGLVFLVLALHERHGGRLGLPRPEAAP
jgi:hypothetical protein